jgi:hypothetical protein
MALKYLRQSLVIFESTGATKEIAIVLGEINSLEKSISKKEK